MVSDMKLQPHNLCGLYETCGEQYTFLNPSKLEMNILMLKKQLPGHKRLTNEINSLAMQSM